MAKKTTAKKSFLAKHPQEGVAQKVNRWNHSLHQVTGGLARATGSQSLNRNDLTEWAEVCQQVAKEMLELRKAKAKGGK